jgi:hypothetical protein
MIDRIIYRFATKRLAQMRVLANDPVAAQRAVFNSLIARAYGTAFGRDHRFDRVRNHDDWVRAVPLRDYSAIATYFDRARDGEADVIWPGHIRYWAISSGTTAGEKYLPVSMDTVRGNKRGGFDAIAPCVAETDPGLFNGRLLFLGGSINLRKHGDNWIGDNTGIMTLHIPRLLRRWHTPGQDVAGLPTWEEKITRAAEISSKQDVRMISGVPSWMIIFGEKVLELTGKKSLREVWPNLALFVHGGMSFGPYRERFLQLAGAPVWCTDTYATTPVCCRWSTKACSSSSCRSASCTLHAPRACRWSACRRASITPWCLTPIAASSDTWSATACASHQRSRTGWFSRAA